MFWIQQQPLLSLEKQSSLRSIVSQWPWCVSVLQSVWRIELLFILLHLHIVWPLLKLPCPISSTKYKRCINKSKGWLNADSSATDRNGSAELVHWKKRRSYSKVPWMQKHLCLCFECYLHIIKHSLSAIEFWSWICLMPCLQVLFLYFLCLSNHTLLHMILSASNVVPSFPAEKYHPWRPHLYSLSYKEEAKSRTQQAGISILPICCSSLGEIH